MLILYWGLKGLSPGERDATFCATTCNSDKNKMKLFEPWKLGYFKVTTK